MSYIGSIKTKEQLYSETGNIMKSRGNLINYTLIDLLTNILKLNL
jgi:hypothetical protein